MVVIALPSPDKVGGSGYTSVNIVDKVKEQIVKTQKCHNTNIEM